MDRVLSKGRKSQNIKCSPYRNVREIKAVIADLSKRETD